MRADLAAEYHEDLAALWAARRWRHLIDLVNELPETSRLTNALVNDHDYAARVMDILDRQDDEDEADDPASRSSVREETETVRILRALYDLVLHALGGKGEYPRPITAVELARQQRATDAAMSIIAIFTPWAIDN